MAFLIVIAFVIAVIAGIVKLCYKLTKSGIVVAVILFALACVGLSGCGEPELIVQTESEDVNASESAKLPEARFKATIPETVLVDEKDVKITATSLVCSDSECTLELKFENNTDRELSFEMSDYLGAYYSVNGYLFDGYLFETVAPGMKAFGDINIDKYDLAIRGITEIGTIDICFSIMDRSSEYLITNPVRIETSEKSNVELSADTFKKVVKSIDQIDSGLVFEDSVDGVILDKNGLKIQDVYVISVDNESKAIFFEIENNGENDIHLETTNISINGVKHTYILWSSNGTYSGYIPKGTREIVSIWLGDVIYDAKSEDLGFFDICDVCFDIEIKNKDFDIIDTKHVEIKYKDYSVDESGTDVYDDKGVKIIYKGLIDDTRSYIESKNLLFLVKNGSGKEIIVGSNYDDLYVNKNKVSSSPCPIRISDGEFGLFHIKMEDSVEIINEISTGLQIKDSSSEEIIDEQRITLEVK